MNKRDSAHREATRLYILCGLAFAGKSTLAAAVSRLTGAAVVSLDEINAERGLYGGVGIPPEEWGRSHAEARERVAAALQAGRSVVVDDTGCFRFLRDDYRRIAEAQGVPALVLHLDAPLDLVRARMRANEIAPSRAPVTESVLRDLIDKFEPPTADEAVLVVPADADLEAWIREHLRSRPANQGRP